jgi:hypothetical protein
MTDAKLVQTCREIAQVCAVATVGKIERIDKVVTVTLSFPTANQLTVFLSLLWNINLR